MTVILITLLIFTLIVVIHEWGHFMAAKKCNIFIEEFAVGMGPKLFGVKKGDTLYSVRLLPIGGYCKMADTGPDDSNKLGFNDANVWQRIFISIAGPVMNFILALIVLTFIAMSVGISTNNVTGTIEGYPAEKAGIKAGDKIIGVNGNKINIRDDLSFYMSEHVSEPLEITIKRDGEKFNVNLTPEANNEGQYLIGINMEYKAPCLNLGIFKDNNEFQKAGFFECIAYGFWNMLFLVKVTVLGVARILTFNVPMSEISGPIGVTTVVGDTYKATITQGVIYTVLSMLNLSALLSANLGVINLVPIPALDGGRVLVYAIEVIRGKRLAPEKEGVINLIGFALVMGFGIFVAVSDVFKLM